MSFDISAKVNEFIASLDKIYLISAVSKNPFSCGAAIAIIAVMIILFVFSGSSEESSNVRAVRCGFWIFCTSICTLLLHDRMLFEEKTSGIAEDLVHSTTSGGYEPGGVFRLEDYTVPVTAKIE